MARVAICWVSSRYSIDQRSKINLPYSSLSGGSGCSLIPSISSTWWRCCHALQLLWIGKGSKIRLQTTTFFQCAYITSLCIHPAYRKLGFGRQLISKAIEELRCLPNVLYSILIYRIPFSFSAPFSPLPQCS